MLTEMQKLLNKFGSLGHACEVSFQLSERNLHITVRIYIGDAVLKQTFVIPYIELANIRYQEQYFDRIVDMLLLRFQEKLEK